jgi:hypothetical protein
MILGFIKFEDLLTVISTLSFSHREKSAVLSFVVGSAGDENGVSCLIFFFFFVVVFHYFFISFNLHMLLSFYFLIKLKR